jgi:hypothetical protein
MITQSDEPLHGKAQWVALNEFSAEELTQAPVEFLLSAPG